MPILAFNLTVRLLIRYASIPMLSANRYLGMFCRSTNLIYPFGGAVFWMLLGGFQAFREVLGFLHIY